MTGVQTCALPIFGMIKDVKGRYEQQNFKFQGDGAYTKAAAKNVTSKIDQLEDIYGLDFTSDGFIGSASDFGL